MSSTVFTCIVVVVVVVGIVILCIKKKKKGSTSPELASVCDAVTTGYRGLFSEAFKYIGSYIYDELFFKLWLKFRIHITR